LTGDGGEATYPGLALCTEIRDPVNRHSPSAEDEVLVIDLNPLTRTVLSHTLSLEVPQASVQKMLDATDARAKGPGALSLNIQFIGDTTLLVRGDLQAELEVPCARCLESASAQCTAEICVQAVQGAVAAAPSKRRSKDDEDEDVEVDLDAPDTLTYSGHTLDLRELVAEQVGMAYPMRILCSRGEECRGLCYSCGRNLNDLQASGCAACGGEGPAKAGPAATKTPESPWQAALQAIREREGDA